jgi:hypothetical protein
LAQRAFAVPDTSININWKPLRSIYAKSISIASGARAGHISSVDSGNKSDGERQTGEAQLRSERESFDKEHAQLRSERHAFSKEQAQLRSERDLLKRDQQRLAENRAKLDAAWKDFEKQAASTSRTGKTRRGMKEYGGILRLTGKVTSTDIKNAYRRLALVFHPDRLVGNDQMLIDLAADHFKDVNEAYDFFRKKHGIK